MSVTRRTVLNNNKVLFKPFERTMKPVNQRTLRNRSNLKQPERYEPGSYKLPDGTWVVEKMTDDQSVDSDWDDGSSVDSIVTEDGDPDEDESAKGGGDDDSDWDPNDPNDEYEVGSFVVGDSDVEFEESGDEEEDLWESGSDTSGND